VSASDDHTMFLWLPATGKKPILRMTGHVQVSAAVTCPCAHKHKLFIGAPGSKVRSRANYWLLFK
jgi:hypothetical protein